MSKCISYKMYLVSYLKSFATGHVRPSCLQSLLTPSGKHLTVKYKTVASAQHVVGTWSSGNF